MAMIVSFHLLNPWQVGFFFSFLIETVVQSVLDRKEHVLEQKQLHVCVYQKSLGIIPLGYDTSTPAACIPSYLDLPVAPPCILQFWLNSPKIQQAISYEMQQIYCLVVWPDQAGDPLRLCCTLQQDMANIQQLAETWERQVKDTMLSVRNRYECLSIQPLQQAWQTFLCNARNFTSVDKDALSIVVMEDSCEVLVVGNQQEVMHTFQELHWVLDDVIDQMNREAKSVKESIAILQPHQIQLLLAHDVLTRMRQDLPHVQSHLTKEKIFLTGLPQDIMQAKLQIFEFVQSPLMVFIKMSSGLKDLLQRQQVQDVLKSEMQKKHIIVVWEPAEDGIKLYALSKDKLRRGEVMIKECLLEKEITVQPRSFSVLNGEEWNAFVNSINNHPLGLACIHVHSAGDENLVILYATNEFFEETVEKIETFLEQHTIWERFLEQPCGVARFISTKMQKQIDEIANGTQERVVAEVCWRDERCGVRIQGTSKALAIAYSKVEALSAQVQHCSHNVMKMGMETVFSGVKGRQFREALEARLEVTIDIGDENLSAASGATDHGLKQKEVKYKVDTGGMTLFVVKADLPSYPAEAIVNAANVNLQHNGGLAASIVEAGKPLFLSILQFWLPLHL